MFQCIHDLKYGIGIPADQVDRIFGKYYQVENTYTKDMAGTGIGLFLVREFVKLHHGSVEVESKEGTGSTFTVHLLKGRAHFPSDLVVSESSSEKEEITELKENQRDPGKTGAFLQGTLPTLLLIEDNPEMIQYLKNELSGTYTIHTGMNGEEGVQKTVELIPDLIISDVMMPLMDGYRFCEEVKRDPRTSHIPVILLTARNMHKDRITGLKSGADDYLEKPFHLDELLLRIRYHLDKRKDIQEEFLKKFRINAETEFAISVKDQFLKDVFSRIEEHLSDDQFGVEKLSELMGMSRKHINYKIKSLTDQAPNELIRNFRLRRAAYLLSEKGVSVTEACYSVGFNNISYFSKCFTEFYGNRPSDYRN
jgi:DNA-binding response OmpR family regulator